MKVLICGISFKEDCPDIRNSKVFDLIKLFEEKNFNVDVYDPIADLSKDNYLKSSNKLIEFPTNQKYDVIVMAVAHNIFRKTPYNTLNKILNNKGIIFDFVIQ